ncbi:MAG: archaellin/type IV pilin N-terminal domain-containing protein [Candidatus Hadarchaeales archaeon]
MDSKGVSPMIATIVLIAIVFAVAAILALSLASAPQPSVIFSGQLSLENIENGRTAITIRHTYGERANDVIENANNAVRWKNLELRINGEIIQPGPNSVMISEGTKVTWGATAKTYAMVVGDRIYIPLPSALKIGDTVSLKWVPKDQVLVEKTVEH